MVTQAAGGDGRSQSRPLDESDAAPTPPGAGGDDAGAAAAKKRKLASTARGVANLTPEQLAKKRANGMLSIAHSYVDTTDTGLRSRGAEGYSRAHKEPDSNSGAPRGGAHQPATVPGIASGYRGQGSSREGECRYSPAARLCCQHVAASHRCGTTLQIPCFIMSSLTI